MARPKKPVDVDQLLQQGLQVIQTEINKIEKNQVDLLIDRTAAQTLNEYLRTLIALKREGRQAHIEEDLENMEDDELKVLAKQAMKWASKEQK